MRDVFPLGNFGRVGHTAFPGGAFAGAKLLFPGASSGRFDSFLIGPVFFTVMVTRTLGNGYTLARLGQGHPFGTITALDAIRFARVYNGNVPARPLARVPARSVVLTGRTLYA